MATVAGVVEVEPDDEHVGLITVSSNTGLSMEYADVGVGDLLRLILVSRFIKLTADEVSLRSFDELVVTGWLAVVGASKIYLTALKPMLIAQCLQEFTFKI